MRNGLNCNFTVMSATEILMAIVGVKTLIPYASKDFLLFSFQRCMFNLCVQFSFVK